MQKKKRLDVYNEISKFITFLDSYEESLEETDHDIFFSFADEGSLLLNRKDSGQYRKNLRLLLDLVGDENFSSKMVEKLYQKTILTALDIGQKRRELTLKQRIEVAINELDTSLSVVPTPYSVYYPVNGLDPEGLPFQIGNVQFCIFDGVHLERFTQFKYSHTDDLELINNRLFIADKISHSEIIGRPVGLIEVMAHDNVAAKMLAIKELQLILDVINFFSDIIPFNEGFVYLPGQNDRLTINVPIISEDGTKALTFGWEVAGPLTSLYINKLLENDKKRGWGFYKISKILAKKRNSLEEKIITAIRWAGKATVESNKEEAFLLFAISLESLIMCDNEKDELSYRLRTRIAHLLGEDLNSRQKITNNIRDLYSVRSSIVHSGRYQVTDSDLSLIRQYAKLSIFRILNEEPFSSMNSTESLVGWFNQEILT